MKITAKILHKVELELTEEQKEAIHIVNEVILDLYNIMLAENTEGFYDNNNGNSVSCSDLVTTSDTLDSLIEGSSFRYFEDTD